MTVAFFVPGIPAPGGSKKAFRAPATGSIVVKDDAKGNKAWRERVAYFARQAHADAPLAGPLRLAMGFVLPRPKGHWGRGRNSCRLLPSAPEYPAVKPDTTKLLRAAEDALKGILWRDDSQVVRQVVSKDYGDTPGVHIEVRPMGRDEG